MKEFQLIEINTKNLTLYIQQLFEIDQSNFPTPWSLDAWMSLFDLAGNRVFGILNKENNLVASCLYDCNQFSLQSHLLKITVQANYRGRGLGKMIFKETSEAIKLLGMTNCYLEVSEKNLVALRMYQEIGFKTLTIKKKFYSNGDNANAMQLWY